MRYDMEAGKKAAPRWKELAPQVSIIHKGRDGSNMAIPKFPIVIAPELLVIHLTRPKSFAVINDSGARYTVGCLLWPVDWVTPIMRERKCLPAATMM